VVSTCIMKTHCTQCLPFHHHLPHHIHLGAAKWCPGQQMLPLVNRRGL
jgi:hypothetical protein